MTERVASARHVGAIRIGDVIEQIIARDNLERPVSPFARMPAPPTQQRAGQSGLNAHLPPFRHRVDSSDEEEADRLFLLPRRLQLEFYDGDYRPEEDTEPELLRRGKKTRLRMNPFIDADAGVDGDASNNDGFEDENDDLDDLL